VGAAGELKPQYSRDPAEPHGLSLGVGQQRVGDDAVAEVDAHRCAEELGEALGVEIGIIHHGLVGVHF
jgi:hypothetical protein